MRPRVRRGWRRRRHAPRRGLRHAGPASLGRLENGLLQGGDWYHWGPYLSERQWGTVREDYSAQRDGVGIPPPRPRAITGLSLGGGRARRLLGRGATPLPGALALERARPDPEGANLRAHRRPGKPRRGRQGVLVVPRCDTDPLLEPVALPLPAGCVSLRGTRRENARRGKQDPEFECSTRDLRGRPLLDRGGRLRKGRRPRPSPHRSGDEPGTRRTRSTSSRRLWYRNTWSWEIDGEKPELPRRAASSETEHPFLGALEFHADVGPDGNAPSLLFCENETNDERIFGTPGPRTRRTASTTTSSPAPPRSIRTRTARRPRTGIGSRSIQGRPSSCGYGCGSPGKERSPWADFDAVVAKRRQEADEFYAGLTPEGAPPTRPW